jgi:hypothetical protein
LEPRRICAAFALASLGAACDRNGGAPRALSVDGTSAPASAAGPSTLASLPPARVGWLKGQLHLHSNRSGDSETPPDEVAAWYAAKGYDFIVFTDHNRVTDPPDPPGMLTLAGVELTQNLETCDPPPRPGHACLLHVDALFVRDAAPITFPEPTPSRRVNLYGRAVDLAHVIGGVSQLNHPNFHHGADLEVLLALAGRGLALVEIANMAVDSANEGDAAHPSTEALWDAALSRGARVFATATDDAHHYGDAERVRARGETVYVGDLGWVMVRAAKEPDAIRAAVARGDFYASTGAVLDQLELAPERIAIEVAGASDGVEIEIVGEGGAVLERAAGRALSFDPRGSRGRYVRARVRTPRGDAWTQPLFR